MKNMMNVQLYAFFYFIFFYSFANRVIRAPKCLNVTFLFLKAKDGGLNPPKNLY